MEFQVVLIHGEDGYAVTCPGMPGCWTQGVSEAEALENVQEAMSLWLEAGGAPLGLEQTQPALAEILAEARRDGLPVRICEVKLLAGV